MKLSIGGTHFTTSRSTLVPASGFFSAYLSGRIPPTLDDAAPPSWTARDAQHFPKILAFLRDGAIPQWSDEGERGGARARGGFLPDRGGYMRVVGPAQNMVSPPVPRTSACATRRTSSGALRERARRRSDLDPHTHLIDSSPHSRPSSAAAPSWTSCGRRRSRASTRTARRRPARVSVVPASASSCRMPEHVGGCSRGSTGRTSSPPDPLR